MSNKFKSITATDSSIKSIGARPVRGVMIGGYSDKDIEERIGQLVVVSETGKIDSSLIPGGGGGGGITEEEVRRLITARLAPYDNGEEIDARIVETNAKIKTDAQLNELMDAKIALEVEPGRRIDNAITGKGYITENRAEQIINEKALIYSDLTPYNDRSDKKLTGASIKADIDKKLSIADFQNEFRAEFGEPETGDTTAGQLHKHIKTQDALKVNIAAMAPFADDPDKIGEAIQKAGTSGVKIAAMAPYNSDPDKIGEAIQRAIARGAEGMSEAKFQLFMDPYGRDDPAATGDEIKAAIDARTAKTDYDADFKAFESQPGANKGEKIKSYVDTTGGGIKPEALAPYADDPAKIGAAINQDVRKVENQIKTDDQIKALAEVQIAADLQPGGSIDAAITAKKYINETEASALIRAEAVIPDDMAPYNEGNGKATIGAEIHKVMNRKLASATWRKQVEEAFGDYGDNITPPQQVRRVMDKQDALKVDIAAMEPFNAEPNKIGAAIKKAIDEGGGGGGGGFTEKAFMADMKPFNTGAAADVGKLINDAIGTKLTEKTYRDEWRQGWGVINPVEVKRVVDMQDALKVDKVAMAPFNTDDDKIGRQIYDSILLMTRDRVKVDAMAPFDTDPSKIGAAIKKAIDEGVGTPGITEESFQGYMHPYSRESNPDTGAMIQKDINSVRDTFKNYISRTQLSICMSPFSASGGVEKTGENINRAMHDYLLQKAYKLDWTSGWGDDVNCAEKAKAVVDAQDALKVNIKAMAPFAENPDQIGAAIKKKIEDTLPTTPVITEEAFEGYMRPFSKNGNPGTGREIENSINDTFKKCVSLDLFKNFMQPFSKDTLGVGPIINQELAQRLNVIQYREETGAAFGEFVEKETVPARIKRYIDAQDGGRVATGQMQPYNKSGDIGINIQADIVSKIRNQFAFLEQPIGTIIFALENPGRLYWLECDGSQFERGKWPALWRYLQSTTLPKCNIGTLFEHPTATVKAFILGRPFVYRMEEETENGDS